MEDGKEFGGILIHAHCPTTTLIYTRCQNILMGPYVARHPMHGTLKENISHPVRTLRALFRPKNRSTFVISAFFSLALLGAAVNMFAPSRQEAPSLPKVNFYDAANAYHSLHVQVDSLLSATSRQQALALYQSIKKNAQTATDGFRPIASGEQSGTSASTALMDLVIIEVLCERADSQATNFGIETPLQNKR